MKLLPKLTSFFPNLSKSKKLSRTESPSFSSSTTTTASSDDTTTTPISVLNTRQSSSNTRPKISKRELEIVLNKLGPHDPPTEDELDFMAAEIDPDGWISLDKLGEAAGNDELRDAFSVFDADGDGKISPEELLGIFIAIGDDGCTIGDCRRMIEGVDSDGDGLVCFGDFVRMMDCQR